MASFLAPRARFSSPRASILVFAAPARRRLKSAPRSAACRRTSAGAFDEIAACHLLPDGTYLVFDRRAHAVYTFRRGADSRRRSSRSAARPAGSSRPTSFDSAPDGTFVVADAPGNQRRLQFFTVPARRWAGSRWRAGPVPSSRLET